MLNLFSSMSADYKPRRIVISRVDNIGDVVLTLPLAALLKKRFPEAEVTVLARTYVADLVLRCQGVDHFLDWTLLQEMPVQRQCERLSSYDVILHVSPNKRIAQLAKRAGIACRIGTSRRWFHWVYCTNLVAVRRKHSGLYEAELNTQLLAPLQIPALTGTSRSTRNFLGVKNRFNCVKHLRNRRAITRGTCLVNAVLYLPTKISSTSRGALTPHAMLTQAVTIDKGARTSVSQWLDKDKFNLVVHMGSHGHTVNWPASYFVDLLNCIDTSRVHIILTGSAQEGRRFEKALRSVSVSVQYTFGQLTLNELITLIAHADGFVGNATGPLHLAGALGVKSVGLYPPYAHISPARWRPLGHAVTCLVSEETQEKSVCMETLSVNAVLSIIAAWWVDAGK